MKINRDVILDLLPLYLAGEASEETQRLVETYLEQDPELARLAAQMNDPLLPEIPIPLTTEDEMKTFNKVKRLMFQHNLFLILAIVFTFLFAMGLTFLYDERPIGPVIFALIAALFWGLYVRVNRQLAE